MMQRLSNSTMASSNKNENESGSENRKRTAGFNVFIMGNYLTNYLNFSWNPYYYDIKYGSRQRVFFVMYRHCRLRLFFNCLQMTALLMWLSQTSYNGFNIAESLKKSNINHDALYESYMIWRLITYDLFANLKHYRRKLSIITFLYGLNTFIQRLYCLFRHQIAKESHRLTKYRYYISRLSPEKESIGYADDFLRYQEFLFSSRFTMKEYILYFVLNRPIPDYLIRENPVLKETTHQDELEFDLMALHRENKLLVTSQVFKYLIRTTLLVLVLFSITPTLGVLIYNILLDIQLKSSPDDVHLKGSTDYGDIRVLFRNFSLLSCICLNLVTFGDTYLVALNAIVISSRLSIYNTQLIQFIVQLRTIARTYTQQHGRLSVNSDDSIQENSKNFALRRMNLRTNRIPVYPLYSSYCDRNDSSYSFSDRRKKQPNILSNDSFRDKLQACDSECEKLLMVLHQLLFEVKLMKDIYSDRIDLDILVSLCSCTWVVSSMVNAYNCGRCSGVLTVTLPVFGSVGLGYMLNIIAQVFFLSQLSQKVFLQIN